MSELTNRHPFQLPLRDRVRHGLRRGALVGVYCFALIWLASATRHVSHTERVMSQPVTAAATIIAGFTIAGGLLLALGPRVHNVGSAIAVAVVCWLPVSLGIFAAPRSLTIAALPFVGAMSLLGGVIWGTMYRKGWYRRHSTDER